MTIKTPFPSHNDLNICFAHVAYPMDEVFLKRDSSITYSQARNPEELNKVMKLLYQVYPIFLLLM